MRIAAYPGSFDPPTVAHLAVAEAALDQLEVDRVDLVISLDPLGKDAAGQVRVRDRLAVIGAVTRSRPWLGSTTTEHRLIADIAAGYRMACQTFVTGDVSVSWVPVARPGAPRPVAQPSPATRASSPSAARAPDSLRPTAPIKEPPNQAASPMSWRDRANT